MPDISSGFTQGKMNKDLDERLIPNGEYRDAMNVQVSTSEGSDVGTVQNILGNVLANTGSQVVGGNWECVGAIADEKNDVLYSFIWNTSNRSAIIEYNKSGDVTPILVDINGDVLKFEEGEIITGINIIDNLLFWTDNRNEPKKINIDNFKRNNHTNLSTHSNFYVNGSSVGEVKEEHITVIKKRPTKAPYVDIVSTLRSGKTNGTTNDRDGGVDFYQDSVGLYRQLKTPGKEVNLWIDQSEELILGNRGVDPNDPNLGIQSGVVTTSTNWKVGDKLVVKESEQNALSGNDGEESREGFVLPYTYQAKLKVLEVYPTTAKSSSGWEQRFRCEIIDVDDSIPNQDPASPLLFEVMLLDEAPTIYELKFPRFATRYKYEDGEYSAFSPFSEVAFAANVFSYHPTKDPYNLAMVNNAKSIKIQDFVPADIPDGVVQVDILYKQEDSPVIYSVASLKPSDPNGSNPKNPWNSTGSSVINSDSNIHATDKGSYEITTDVIHAALPSNQLLRPWDNVPRRALGQEITGNRLIYGNYLQNYDIGFKPEITAGYRARKIEGSGQVEPGQVGNRSIKSLRDYQLGVVYGDKYGRETPVFTDIDASFSVPMIESRDSNQIWVTLKGLQPSDMDYYKVFVKQSSGEYYNLIMDRVYRAEKEENLWLSFPSSDVNKIKKDDFIILKKQIDVEKAVTVENKFKVIDIQSSAPEFIKAKFVEIGAATSDQISTTTGTPIMLQTALSTTSKNITIDQGVWKSINPMLFTPSSQILMDGNVNAAAGGGVASTARTNVEPLSIVFYRNDSNSNQIGLVTNTDNEELASKRYEILTYEDTGTSIEFTLKDDGISKEDMNWIGVSGTSINSNVSFKLFKEDRRNRPEFEGRFFVKILSNDITKKFLEGQIEVYGREKVVGSASAYFLADESGTYNSANVADYQNSHSNLLLNGVAGTNDPAKWKSDSKWYWTNRLLYLSGGNAKADTKWFIDQMYFKAYQPPYTFDPRNMKLPNTTFMRGIHSPGIGYTNPNKWELDPATGQPKYQGNFLGWDDEKSFYEEGKSYINLSFFPVGDDLHDGAQRFTTGKNAALDYQSVIPTGNTYAGSFNRQKFDNQWNIKGQKSLISGLVEGAKFSYRKPTGELDTEIYQIKKVKKVHLYNYMKWGEVQAKINAFEHRVVQGNFNQTTDGNNACQTLKDFGLANNRRVTYILEIENITGGNDNPHKTTTGQYNPIDYSGTPDADLDTPVTIEITSSVVEELSQEISTNPAVWETEPQETVDLDIYYEASQAIPINLDNNDKRSHLLAPIGSKIWCSHKLYDSGTDFEQPMLVNWENGNEIVMYPGLTALHATSNNDYAVEEAEYRGKTIRFFRDDFSFTSAKIEDVLGIKGPAGNKRITKIRLNNNNIGTAVGLPFSNCFTWGNGVESNRIRDDFNKMQITNGVKASKVLEEPYNEERRTNGLIYSGIYNSTSGINSLNEFIQAEKITKDVSPRFGSIQKLHARDTNLIALCEDKCLKILVNKDALFNADGNSQLLSTENYLGQTIPFIGEYGISKNPESFAAESYRSYFVDKQRGAVLRLSQDGITPISNAGMSDYFKDKLKEPAYNIIGSYDSYKKEYNLTIDDGSGAIFHPDNNPDGDAVTLSFSETVRGWVSFKSFIPEFGLSMANDYYTFKNGKCYKHHSEEANRNKFYTDSTVSSSITSIFNDLPTIVKSFKALGYQGDSDWVCPEIITDKQSGTVSEFIEKEGKWFNHIKGKTEEQRIESEEEIDIKAFNFQGIGTPVAIEQL